MPERIMRILTCLCLIGVAASIPTSAFGNDVGPMPPFVFEFSPDSPNSSSNTVLTVLSLHFFYPEYETLTSSLTSTGSRLDLVFINDHPPVIPDGPHGFSVLQAEFDLGVLSPGEYTIDAEMLHRSSTGEVFLRRQGGTTFTVVPEPAAILVVATASLALVSRRRTRHPNHRAHHLT